MLKRQQKSQNAKISQNDSKFAQKHQMLKRLHLQIQFVLKIEIRTM